MFKETFDGREYPRIARSGMKMNEYQYEKANGQVRGFFNIYQAVNGKIYIQLGIKYASLTSQQINDLGIDVFNLTDFNLELYDNAYRVDK